VWNGPKVQSGIGQKALRDRATVDQIEQDMKSGKFDWDGSKNILDPGNPKYPLDGRVGGWKDAQGNYYLGEGHHRMAAAMEHFEATGDATFVNKLLQHGDWQTPPVRMNVGPLPR